MKALFLTFVVAVFITGCSSAIQMSTQYYQFEQPISPASRNINATNAQLRVQMVTLRGALNNRGIAMKIDNNQIHAANYHLWAESPDIMLTATAQNTLFKSMPKWMVIKGLPIITEQDQQVFFELEQELHHFNGDLRGNAHIAGLWRLFYTHPETGRQLVSINHFSKHRAITEDGYDGLVLTLQDIWHSINLDIATELQMQSHEVNKLKVM